MRNISATQFKTQCLELMDRVAEQRVGYVITKRGKPVAQLVPIARKPKESIFGWLRAAGSIQGEIVNPVLSPEEWQSIEEWDHVQRGRGPRRARASRDDKR